MLTGSRLPDPNVQAGARGKKRFHELHKEDLSACAALSEACGRHDAMALLPPEAVALIDGLLTHDPSARLSSASQILRCAFFTVQQL
jgi:hypothetical protein